MENSAISKTPEPPYYAVIFTSTRTEWDRGYGKMAEKMNSASRTLNKLLVCRIQAWKPPAAVNRRLECITVSYWKSLEDIARWKADTEHQIAQQTGKNTWYRDYRVRIAKVERDYGKNP